MKHPENLRQLDILKTVRYKDKNKGVKGSLLFIAAYVNFIIGFEKFLYQLDKRDDGFLRFYRQIMLVR
jgi:hypothetical protein